VHFTQRDNHGLRATLKWHRRGGYQQQKAILDQIATMQNQLVNLSKPSAPLFSGSSLDILSREGAAGTQNNTMNFSFPNWSPTNPADIKYLSDYIVEEMNRRAGRS